MSETDPTGTTHNLKVDGQPAKLVEGRGRSKSFGLLMNDLAQRQSATIAELQSSLSAARAEVEALKADAERLAAIADLKHVSINQWAVQAYRDNETVGTAYHAQPMVGTPRIHESKLDALRAAIDQSRTKEQPK